MSIYYGYEFKDFHSFLSSINDETFIQLMVDEPFIIDYINNILSTDTLFCKIKTVEGKYVYLLGSYINDYENYLTPRPLLRLKMKAIRKTIRKFIQNDNPHIIVGNMV